MSPASLQANGAGAVESRPVGEWRPTPHLLQDTSFDQAEVSCYGIQSRLEDVLKKVTMQCKERVAPQGLIHSLH